MDHMGNGPGRITEPQGNWSSSCMDDPLKKCTGESWPRIWNNVLNKTHTFRDRPFYPHLFLIVSIRSKLLLLNYGNPFSPPNDKVEKRGKCYNESISSRCYRNPDSTLKVFEFVKLLAHSINISMITYWWRMAMECEHHRVVVCHLSQHSIHYS